MASPSEPHNTTDSGKPRSANPLSIASSSVQRLSGTIVVPGDRLMSHFVLLLAVVSNGQSRICGLPETDDVTTVIEVLASRQIHSRTSMKTITDIGVLQL